MEAFGLVSLKHKKLIQTHLESILEPFSEQTFSNLFLYRNLHNFQLYQNDLLLCATGISYDNMKYLLPLQKMNDIKFLIHLAHELNADCLYPIDESIWPSYSEQGLNCTFCPDDSDYLYERDQFNSLSGKNLSKKKNLYHQFIDTYNWELRPLDATTLNDAHTVLDTWYKDRQEAQDAEAMYDGLRFYDDLELLGWITYVDKQPVGIYYGEICSNTFVDHCAKGLPDIKGLSTFIHIECSRHLPACVTKLNWEQDLGLEGLRQAKYTFQPYSIRKKGRVLFLTNSIT